MPRKKTKLSEEDDKQLRSDILDIIDQSEDKATTFAELEKKLRENRRWAGILKGRIWEKVQELKDEGAILSKRKVGFWKSPVPSEGGNETKITFESADESAAEKVPIQKSPEKNYYDAIKDWLQKQYGCYALDVSERGKRGRKKDGSGLVAVPDVVGVRYHPGQSRDKLEIIAVEVKVKKPTSNDISEAFRYSRFSDLCYLAYDEESMKDVDIRNRLLEEIARLGIGLLQFPVARGKGKRIMQIRPPTKQRPDDLAKDDYLAKKLDIYECLRCHTYHIVEDDSKLIEYGRSEDWLQEGALSAEEGTVKRYVCESCRTR
ncbi:MAG: hypothetical protein M0Z77_07385 [Thermoplasmatales archaeon]|nr:hypothetical protein [Thermoplasmatales archaeon]